MYTIYVDSEGEPIQEFSALYVNNDTCDIVDVFHYHVKYPFNCDFDWKARRCVHGLDLKFLSQHGISDIEELKLSFSKWLETHPYHAIFAHEPRKEREFLNFPIQNVCMLNRGQNVLRNCHIAWLFFSKGIIFLY